MQFNMDYELGYEAGYEDGKVDIFQVSAANKNKKNTDKYRNFSEGYTDGYECAQCEGMMTENNIFTF